MDAKRINIDQLYQQKEMQLEPLPFGAWEEMSQKLHGNADDLNDKKNLSSGSSNFLFAIALIGVGIIAFYLFSKQRSQGKLVPEIAHVNDISLHSKNKSEQSSNDKNNYQNKTVISSNTELSKVSKGEKDLTKHHVFEKSKTQDQSISIEKEQKSKNNIEKELSKSVFAKNIKLNNKSRKENSKIEEFKEDNLNKADPTTFNPIEQQKLAEKEVFNEIFTAKDKDKERIFEAKTDIVNKKEATSSEIINKKNFYSKSSSTKENKGKKQQLKQTDDAIIEAMSTFNDQQPKNSNNNKDKLVSRNKVSNDKSTSTNVSTTNFKDVASENLAIKDENKFASIAKAKEQTKKPNLTKQKPMKDETIKTLKQNNSDKIEVSSFNRALTFLNSKFGNALFVEGMSLVDFNKSIEKRAVQQFKFSEESKTNFIVPLMRNFDFGIKAGYEFGTSKYAINKSIFAGCIYYNFTDKVSLFFQPAIKLGTNVTYPSFNNTSYYNLTGTTIDTFTIQDSMSTQLLAVVTQNSDSFVVVKKINKGSNVQLEFILGAKYRIGNHFGVSAGIGFNKGVLPYFTEVKTKVANQQQVDSFQAPLGTFLVIDTANSFFHTSANLNQFIPFNGVTQATDPLRINYFASVEYWYNRWSLELSVTQQLTKLSNLNDKNIQSSYEQPYIRIMAGWKIRK